VSLKNSAETEDAIFKSTKETKLN